MGVPVFSYQTKDIANQTAADKAFETLLAADAANYLLGANSDGKGSNEVLKSCGIPESHAFSILGVFSMTDSTGKKHNCILIRDPLGYSKYNQTWSNNDTNWTDDLVS